MSKIKLLPEQVSSKIAAGEVVERPASVVKELVENSLDAGATKITVSVEKSGERLISVIDDGEGMDQDDALLCFELHATSKIFKEEDIMGISSFGFRGEAMPSIASVSKITLRTRRRESQEGVEIVIIGGKLISSAPAGCAPGSEVIVRDLFFNIPARKKFLKSAATEEHHIVEVMTNIALANPHVSFELKLDGRTSFSSPSASTLVPRMRELFGREFADAMLPVSMTEGGVSVKGYIAKRAFTKPSRQEQRTFVNGRPIESFPVYKGIREGCGPMLDKGRYHPAILFLTMNPKAVDVNVHPAKREVRFKSEYEVTNCVRTAVAAALRAGDIMSAGMLTDDFSDSQQREVQKVQEVPHQEETASPMAKPPLPAFAQPSSSVSPPPQMQSSSPQLDKIMRAAFLDYKPQEIPVPQPSLPSFASPAARNIASHADSDSFMLRTPPSSQDLHTPEKTAEKPSPAALGLRLIGILNDSYILAESTEGLVMIDQHAAHERIMFEKIMKATADTLSQKLLIPITLELGRSDMAFVERNAAAFLKTGFEIEPFGQNTVKLNAIPSALPQNNAGGVFRDILSYAAENGLSSGRVDYDIVARAACSAAVKSHDKLSAEEALSLIRQMALCELPFSCPHGRPTLINVSFKEIERRFGRR